MKNKKTKSSKKLLLPTIGALGSLSVIGAGVTTWWVLTKDTKPKDTISAIENNEGNLMPQDNNSYIKKSIQEWKTDFPDYANKITDQGDMEERAFIAEALPNNFYLPEGLQEISDSAFHNATIPKNFVIPDSVTKIYPWAFKEAKISEGFTLPKSFEKSLSEDSQDSKEDSINSKIFLESTWEDGLTWVNDNGYKRDITTVVDNEQNDNKINYDKIQGGWKLVAEKEAKGDISKWQADFPQYKDKIAKTLNIKDGAFAKKTLPDNFYLPEGLKVINELAFHNATIPKNFVIPNSVTKIYPLAFEAAKISEGFALPKSFEKSTNTEHASSQIFLKSEWDPGLTWVNANGYKRDITTIVDNKQNGNKISYEEIKDGWKLVAENEAKGGISKWKQDFPQYADKISDDGKMKLKAFYRKTLPNNFYLPEGFQEISESAFWKTTIPKNFIIPDSVNKINRIAFKDAKISAGFTLPKSFDKTLPNGYRVPSIFWQATWANGLTWVDAKGYKQDIISSGNGRNYSNIQGGWKLVSINEAKSYISEWKKDFPQYANKISDQGVMKKNAFLSKNLPNNFYLPKGLKEISDSGFRSATIPKNFVIPDSVTEINRIAFKDAKISAGFTLPKSFKKTLPNGYHVPSIFWKATWANGLTWVDAKGYKQDIISSGEGSNYSNIKGGWKLVSINEAKS